MATSRALRRFAKMHVSHPEIYPLTFAVGFGSVVATLFPIYSYCQNMEVGFGADYTKGGKMSWYNYIIPSSRKRYSENDQEFEKLHMELFEKTNKKS